MKVLRTKIMEIALISPTWFGGEGVLPWHRGECDMKCGEDGVRHQNEYKNN